MTREEASRAMKLAKEKNISLKQAWAIVKGQSPQKLRVQSSSPRPQSPPSRAIVHSGKVIGRCPQCGLPVYENQPHEFDSMTFDNYHSACIGQAFQPWL